MPPNPSFLYSSAPQTFGLGPVRDGVLAIRVWKAPLFSFDSGQLGGLYFAPLVGSPQPLPAHSAVDRRFQWCPRNCSDFSRDEIPILFRLRPRLAAALT